MTKDEFSSCLLSLECELDDVSFDLDDLTRDDVGVIFESDVERVFVSVCERVVAAGVADTEEVLFELDLSVEIVISALVLAASS